MPSLVIDDHRKSACGDFVIQAFVHAPALSLVFIGPGNEPHAGSLLFVGPPERELTTAEAQFGHLPFDHQLLEKEGQHGQAFKTTTSAAFSRGRLNLPPSSRILFRSDNRMALSPGSNRSLTGLVNLEDVKTDGAFTLTLGVLDRPKLAFRQHAA